eukprot:scaffold7611_cov47-Cyclotella_meneghiniana.AAC.3
MSRLARVTFQYHNFRSLAAEVDGGGFGSKVQTDCNGNKWSLELHPGGDSRAFEQEWMWNYCKEHCRAEPGWMTIYLVSENDFPDRNVKFSLSIRDKYGAPASYLELEHCFFHESRYYGSTQIIMHSEVVGKSNNILKDDTLFVDAVIQVKDDTDDLYQPINNIAKKQLELLHSGVKSDVIFEVEDTVINAHSQILFANAPLLSEICDQGSNLSKVVINDTSPEVFRLLLEHIYSGIMPSVHQVLQWDKSLIDAANKYELIELKIAVENVLVRERILNRENVADYILFADAQSCPLLKEYAISFLVFNSDVLQLEESKHLRESGELLSEIIIIQSRSDEEGMSVTQLRNELGRLRLDVDGSKKVLVSRLEDGKRKEERDTREFFMCRRSK